MLREILRGHSDVLIEDRLYLAREVVVRRVHENWGGEVADRGVARGGPRDHEQAAREVV